MWSTTLSMSMPTRHCHKVCSSSGSRVDDAVMYIGLQVLHLPFLILYFICRPYTAHAAVMQSYGTCCPSYLTARKQMNNWAWRTAAALPYPQAAALLAQ